MNTPLTVRLGWRDLRRRAAESLMLLVALTVAAATLTTGLVLHDQTAAPYQTTRAATAGPDVIGTVFPASHGPAAAARVAALARLAHVPEVSRSSGVLPVIWAALATPDRRAVAAVQGRTTRSLAVDHPRVVEGTWVRHGGVVVERAFAQALDLRVGEHVELDGHDVTVAGLAVTAAAPPFPQVCNFGCILSRPRWHSAKPGLVWTTRSMVRGLTTAHEPVAWFTYLTLIHPESAPGFARAHQVPSPLGPTLFPWQEVERRHAELLADERVVVLFGGSLLMVLALATVVVLIGGRTLTETRRTGMLKALGATPAFLARLLALTYAALAVTAACLGLALGRVLAPHLVRPSAGLLGPSGITSITPATAAMVIGSLLAVALAAVCLPAWRAARTATVTALADAGQPPRRQATLIRISARLPAFALLGVRLSSRRPRRAVLSVSCMAVATCAAVGVLCAQQSLHAETGRPAGPVDPNATTLQGVLLLLVLVLGVMTAITLLFVAHATSVDARNVLAVSRALGLPPAEATWGLGVSQAAPATLGVAVGLPAGLLVVHVLGGADLITPSPVQLVLLGVALVATCLGLTALAGLRDARRPVGELLAES